MKIKCWRTAKCLTIDEFEVVKILVNEDNPEGAKECIDNDWTAYINCEKPDGSWISIPPNFVIEISA